MNLAKLNRAVSDDLHQRYTNLLYVLSVMDHAVIQTEHLLMHTDFRGYLHYGKGTKAVPRFQTTNGLFYALGEFESLYEESEGIAQAIALEIVKNNGLYGENLDTLTKALVNVYDQIQTYVIMLTKRMMLSFEEWNELYRECENEVAAFPEQHIPTVFPSKAVNLFFDVDKIEPWNDMSAEEALLLITKIEERIHIAAEFISAHDFESDALLIKIKTILHDYLDAIQSYKTELIHETAN